MMIELPHTPLVKYTATDTEDGQAAFAENLAHKKLDYKVLHIVWQAANLALMDNIFWQFK